MAHTKVTKAHSANTGAANTYSYSGSFDTFKATEVVVTLDAVKLTYTASTINDSASPREYTVDYSAKTVHIGGADLSSGTIVIRPETDLGSPTPRATYSPGASITSEDLNNNQTQLLRRAMEYEEQVLFTTGGTMTGVLGIGAGSAVVFEGDTVDGNDTNLKAVDPTGTNNILLPNISGTLITTGDTGTVSTGMVAASAITTAKIADLNVTTAKLANDAVTNAKIADNSIDSEHYVDGSIDHEHLAVDIVQAENIADNNITNALMADDAINTAEIVDNAVTNPKIATNAVTTAKIVDSNVTTAKIADLNVTTGKIANDAITIGKIGCEQTTISDSDSHIPTSGAVVDYVISQLDPIGGLEAITTETNFANEQPRAGVIVSIADAGGLVVNGSGVSTTGRTQNGQTVTISGIASNFYNSTVVAGVRFLVSSTGSGQNYTYHKATLKESDLVQLSDDINDFNERYRIASGEPGSNNDDGDLVWDTNANQMKVYNSSTSAWEDLHSAGDFKSLYLCPAGGSGAPTLNGSIATYDLRESSNSGAVANVTRAQQLIVSVNGVVQKANTGTSAPAEGFALVDTNTIIFGANLASGDSVFIVQIGTNISLSVPADDSVTTAKILDANVTTAKIAADAITGAKIADDAINSEHYTDGSIDTAHIADSQITTVKIAADAVHGSKIANDQIDSEHYVDGSIDTAHIADLNVTTAKIAADAITGAKIADDAVGAEHIEVLDDHVRWADNKKAEFGTDGDLDVYCNGTDAYISTATADLYLDAATNIWIRPNANENGIKVVANGAVELYHNDSKQCETTSAGLQLHGTGSKLTRSANSDDPFIEITNAQYSNSLYIGGWAETNSSGISRIRNSNNNLHLDSGSSGILYLQGYSGQSTYTKNVSPSDNDSHDLGTSSLKWDDVYATNATIQTSDRNQKNTIVDSDLGLAFVNKLKPVSYKYNGKTRTHYGLIAQDVETVLSDISKPTTDFAGFIKEAIPDIVYQEAEPGIPEGKSEGDLKTAAHDEYGLRYNEFISPLIKAVQELSTEVETLKTKVAALEAK